MAIFMVLGLFGQHLGEWQGQYGRLHTQITFKVTSRPFGNNLDPVHF